MIPHEPAFSATNVGSNSSDGHLVSLIGRKSKDRHIGSVSSPKERTVLSSMKVHHLVKRLLMWYTFMNVMAVITITALLLVTNRPRMRYKGL